MGPRTCCLAKRMNRSYLRGETSLAESHILLGLRLRAVHAGGVGFPWPSRLRLPRRFRLSLGLGLFERHGAAGDLDDILLDGGDGPVHAGPDADGEALVDGLAYLLPEGDLVALGDERGRRL